MRVTNAFLCVVSESQSEMFAGPAVATVPSGDSGHFSAHWITMPRLLPVPNFGYFRTEKYDHGADEFCGKSREAMKKCVEATKGFDTAKQNHRECFLDAACNAALQDFRRCKVNTFIADPRGHAMSRDLKLTADDLFR